MHTFLKTSLQAAAYHGQDDMDNLRFTKNQFLKCETQLFEGTEKLIEDQREIGNLTTIDCKRATSLLFDKASL